MKTLNTSFFKSNAFTALLFTVLSFLMTTSLNAQESKPEVQFTRVVETKPEFSKKNFLANADLTTAEGNFIIKDGYLDDLKTFTLAMPLTAVNEVFAVNLKKDSLAFKLTHVMILPIMGLVHIVGDLKIAGVTKRTELDFNYTINQDQTITLLGSKTIKLSDYNKGLISNDLKSRHRNEIILELNLLFKDKQATFIAANN